MLSEEPVAASALLSAEEDAADDSPETELSEEVEAVLPEPPQLAIIDARITIVVSTDVILCAFIFKRFFLYGILPCFKAQSF